MRGILRWILLIMMTIGFIFSLYWIGAKGFLGIIIGMGLMAYLLLSKNGYLLGLVQMMKAGQYLDDMIKEDEDDKQEIQEAKFKEYQEKETGNSENNIQT